VNRKSSKTDAIETVRRELRLSFTLTLTCLLIVFHNAPSTARAAWWDYTTLATDQIGTHASLRFNAAGHAVLACRDDLNRDLLIWHDADDDLTTDAGEWSLIDSNGNVGQYASLAFVGGNAIVAYYDSDQADLKLWHDTDGDYAHDAGEIAVIDSAGTVGRYAALAVTPSGQAAVAYYVDGSADLKLWYDANADFAASADELRIIQASGSIGQYAAIAVDSAGIATVTFYDLGGGNLLCWHDADGDFAHDDGEIKTVDSAGNVGRHGSLGLTAAGLAVAAYYDDDNRNLKIWYDADGDFGGDAGELRTIESAGDVGQYTGLAFDSLGRVLVSYRDAGSGDTRLWFDSNADFAAPAVGERTAVTDGQNGGFFTEVAVHAASGRIIVAWYDSVEQALTLAGTLYGDVNLDGVVDATDRSVFLDTLLFPDNAAPQVTAAADLSWDGQTDGDDTQKILDLIMGGG